MTTQISFDLQSLARSTAEPVRPGESIGAQINKVWERWGRPPFWRVKAAWYGEAGCFSAAAARDIQDRFVRWRKAEARRAASAAQTETLLRAQREREQLEATRDAIRTQLATIERQLSLADATLRLSRSPDLDR